MAEWVIDDREKECPACGSGPYTYLGQHWARSASCSPPPFTDEQEAVVRGLLLGDGSLEGTETPKLAVSSTRPAHIRWVNDELGWLSRGVTKEKNGEFRVRTVAHDGFGRYLTWSGSGAAPTTGWTLDRTSARLWYACDGSLSFPTDGSTGQITFSAGTDRRARALVRLLRRIGFSPRIWDRRVALPRDETYMWMSWLGDPTPGSEHKWAVSSENYENYPSREQTWVPVSHVPSKGVLAALKLANIETEGNTLSTGKYQEWAKDRPDAPTTPYSRDEGPYGSFEQAANAANVPIKTDMPRGVTAEYVRGVVRAAVVIDGVETTTEYMEWSKESSRRTSMQWVYKYARQELDDDASWDEIKRWAAT